ncbi:hypothetical protein GJW-30_1_00053 [Variibacter gotjawalensis]|uniref:Uncharacterized protein n=1 Tax=Variibacter gotjawalensis TaxID=1333996 RepID=A0A0S3PNP6_9BRAD|nr:hypothetical protein [Variibacter gotjawalensis]RZS49718.1 hypothetical protein EV661_2158 [Variibacter gotjawalensis]BAT57547.1 hypothetical protein GJW-30_1_00053 [Variibacter gotjawalensis]
MEVSPPSAERNRVAPSGRVKRALLRVFVNRKVLLLALRIVYWMVRIVRAVSGG